MTALEAKLRELHEASERISSNLVELEIDSSRSLLEASSLTGESATRWSTASAALTELWRRRGLLEDLLARAEKLKGSRRARELESLLEGPSIELASADVPLAERSLLGTPQVATRCSPDRLLASMSKAFDEVKTVVAGIGAVWDALIPKLDAARGLLRECGRLAEELGESGRHDLESASRALGTLTSAVSADPLSVAPDEVDRLERTLRVIHDDLHGSIALKHGFEARILGARELLERQRSAVREAQAARSELLLKIVVPSPPPELEAHDELARALGQITAMAGSGAWRAAREALEQWSTRTSGSFDEAQRTLEAHRAPIEARNQFRALLEAYQAKAARLGLIEDPTVEGIYMSAHETLYTAPTDLALAGQLMRSYQQALVGATATPEKIP